MDKNVERITAILKQTHGIDISCYNEIFLTRTIERQVIAANLPSVQDYAGLLEENKAEANRLYDLLNITYSEFFRNPFTFEVLSQVILPQVLKNKKEVRIWSAACAGGQEPYSIAIVCDEITAALNKKPVIRLFASDINQTELQIAEAGIYNESSLGNVSLKRLKKYFATEGDKYKVIADLKTNISFSEFNLCGKENSVPPASIYGNFDLVFCSNLLFYFKPEYRQRIMKKITGSLAPEGYLITGEAEAGMVDDKLYRAIFSMASVFQKR